MVIDISSLRPLKLTAAEYNKRFGKYGSYMWDATPGETKFMEQVAYNMTRRRSARLAGQAPFYPRGIEFFGRGWQKVLVNNAKARKAQKGQQQSFQETKLTKKEVDKVMATLERK